MADFGIYTLVSSGPRLFEGKKLRAIVQYGELGAPHVFIESINVEEGFPSASKVLWREKIDVTEKVDATGGVCQGPEGVWSCSLENLRWEDSSLNYEIKSSQGTYKCSAKVTATEGHKIKTDCSKLR